MTNKPEPNTRPLPQPSELVERFNENMQLAHDLIQEAKGHDGPNGGYVTDHLDDAENWMMKAADTFTQLEAQIAKLQADGDKLAGALEQLIKHTTWLESVAPPMCIDGKYMGESLSLADACQALTEWKDRA